MQEQWVRWEPIKNSVQKYVIDSFTHTEEGLLEIIIAEFLYPDKKTHIFFRSWVPGLKESLGPLMQLKLKFLEKEYGKDFYEQWTFFRVGNSSFSQWLSYQSQDIHPSEEFTHYVFITPESILDVAVFGGPEVEFLPITLP